MGGALSWLRRQSRGRQAIRLVWSGGPIRIRAKINGATIEEIKGEFQGGKFGFLGNKEVRMRNFRLEQGN